MPDHRPAPPRPTPSDALTAAGLAVGSTDRGQHDTIPRGDVISQSPAADTEVAVGSAVDYVVSLGVQQVEVPDLSGPAADAPDTITTAGLAVGDATQEYSDTVAAGEVISQSPAAGTSVDIGSRVDYVDEPRRADRSRCPTSPAPPPTWTRRSPTPASPSAR